MMQSVAMPRLPFATTHDGRCAMLQELPPSMLHSVLSRLCLPGADAARRTAGAFYSAPA